MTLDAKTNQRSMHIMKVVEKLLYLVWIVLL